MNTAEELAFCFTKIKHDFILTLCEKKKLFPESFRINLQVHLLQIQIFYFFNIKLLTATIVRHLKQEMMSWGVKVWLLLLLLHIRAFPVVCWRLGADLWESGWGQREAETGEERWRMKSSSCVCGSVKRLEKEIFVSQLQIQAFYWLFEFRLSPQTFTCLIGIYEQTQKTD